MWGEAGSKQIHNLSRMLSYKDKPVREIDNEWVEFIWRVVREGLSDKMTLNIDLNEVSEACRYLGEGKEGAASVKVQRWEFSWNV